MPLNHATELAMVHWQITTFWKRNGAVFKPNKILNQTKKGVKFLFIFNIISFNLLK